MDIVFDASTIISFSDACMLHSLEALKHQKKWNFIIPEGVYEEVFTRPMRTKMFELNAIRIGTALNEGLFETVREPKNIILAQQIMDLANATFTVSNKKLKILHKGESEALAIVVNTSAKILAVDETTTRYLVESPEKIKMRMERVFKKDVRVDQSRLDKLHNILKGVTVVRSVELIALLHKEGMLSGNVASSKEHLKAALYSMKYGGCSVSFDEIKNYVRDV